MITREFLIIRWVSSDLQHELGHDCQVSVVSWLRLRHSHLFIGFEPPLKDGERAKLPRIGRLPNDGRVCLNNVYLILFKTAETLVYTKIPLLPRPLCSCYIGLILIIMVFELESTIIILRGNVTKSQIILDGRICCICFPSIKINFILISKCETTGKNANIGYN